MGQTREALFESKNPVEKSETRPQTAFFYPLSLKKNKKYSEKKRRNRERAHTRYVSRNERRGAFLKRCAHLSLSLSLSGWWHATTTTTTGENENEREREKIENCFAIYFVPFRARAKIFVESFFSSSSSLSKRTTRDAFGQQQQQRHEQKRERKRE